MTSCGVRIPIRSTQQSEFQPEASAPPPWAMASGPSSPSPRLGVNEDPVAGSARCILILHWAERPGKTDMSTHRVTSGGCALCYSLKGGRVPGSSDPWPCEANLPIPVNFRRVLLPNHWLRVQCGNFMNAGRGSQVDNPVMRPEGAAGLSPDSTPIFAEQRRQEAMAGRRVSKSPSGSKTPPTRKLRRTDDSVLAGAAHHGLRWRQPLGQSASASSGLAPPVPHRSEVPQHRNAAMAFGSRVGADRPPQAAEPTDHAGDGGESRGGPRRGLPATPAAEKIGR